MLFSHLFSLTLANIWSFLLACSSLKHSLPLVYFSSSTLRSLLLVRYFFLGLLFCSFKCFVFSRALFLALFSCLPFQSPCLRPQPPSLLFPDRFLFLCSMSQHFARPRNLGVVVVNFSSLSHLGNSKFSCSCLLIPAVHALS